jgi:L-ascorbate metabolism protein UlaG (beta-lactamase superfamily)
MSNDITLTLIGGPTVLIEIAGFRLLTDPTFDAPQDYLTGAVPLFKTTGPAIDPDALGRIDAVLLSHDQHLDNLDHAGRAFLPKAGTTFVTPVGAARLGGKAKGLAPWESATLEGADGQKLIITATPARHGPHGFEPISGDVAGFLIGIAAPGDAIWFSGDTVWYDGLRAIAERFDPRLLLLNAGSAEPRGRFHVTMDSNDVIETAAAFPNAKIAAIHNEGWAHFKETAADLEQAFAAVGVGERLVGLERGVGKKILI